MGFHGYHSTTSGIGGAELTEDEDWGGGMRGRRAPDLEAVKGALADGGTVWWSGVCGSHGVGRVVLVNWCIGVLVCWCAGVLVYWSADVLVYWLSCVLVVWLSGVLVYWLHGVVACWYTGVLMYWCTGLLVYWLSGIMV